MRRVRALLLLFTLSAAGLAGCGMEPLERPPSDPAGALPDARPGTSPDAGLGDPEPDAEPAEPEGELRGVWITRFAFSDRATLEAIIDRAAAANFNAVFVQVRGTGDAYYRSAHEPWAKGLTGVLGRDPGWDPLQVALERAHSHGMELHAYVNVLSAWPADQPIPEAEGLVPHPLRAHPDWLAVDSTGRNTDGEYQWFTPGVPAVRDHIVLTMRDLLSKYDVDGLHLDRIRVPGPDYSRDPVTTAAFDAARAADPSLTWGEFMREQVSAIVADVHRVLVETRPAARLSAAVWGIYQPLPGCSTSQGYGHYYQDSLAWVQRGIVDALVPMIYWSIEPGSCTDWAALLDGFLAGRAGRHVWAGMHALDKIDGVSTWAWDRVRARIDYARQAGAQGIVVFASSYLDADPARWRAFVGDAAAPGPFFEPVPTPGMDWKP